MNFNVINNIRSRKVSCHIQENWKFLNFYLFISRLISSIDYLTSKAFFMTFKGVVIKFIFLCNKIYDDSPRNSQLLKSGYA